MAAQLVVLDTNIIVSAGINANGLPEQIVAAALSGRFQFVICEEILAEYKNVLARPKFAKYRFPPTWFDRLLRTATVLPTPPRAVHSSSDPKDQIFLDMVSAYGCVVVTGNLKHFPEAQKAAQQILDPAQFAETYLQARPSVPLTVSVAAKHDTEQTCVPPGCSNGPKRKRRCRVHGGGQ